MARILHLADTHLGRLLYGVRLLDDQRHLLQRVLALVDERRPDLLVIAGDVYDRSVPPAEAVALFDDFLYAVAGEREVTVLVTSGNHDGPERLSFGSRLLGRRGVHIVAGLDAAPTPLVLHDEHGEVRVFALPFLEPARVRELTGNAAVVDQATAMAEMVGRCRAAAGEARSVLVAHAFVAGGQASDSERPLAIGGVETVDASVFDGFDYVALGHLHRPQSVGSERVQYAGSLFRYSPGELGHDKSVTLAELGPPGELAVERVELVPKRQLRRVEGLLPEFEAQGTQGSADDYVIARLHDRGPILDAMARVRALYPNALHVEQVQREADGQVVLVARDHRRMQIQELFASFFEAVTDEPLTEAEHAELLDVVGGLDADEVSP